jgi:hypothetical protein
VQIWEFLEREEKSFAPSRSTSKANGKIIKLFSGLASYWQTGELSVCTT